MGFSVVQDGRQAIWCPVKEKQMPNLKELNMCYKKLLPKKEFQIFNKEKPTPVFFKLDYYGGRITLMVCDEKGNSINRGRILSITEDGEIKLWENINNECGLKTTHDGTVTLNTKKDSQTW